VRSSWRVRLENRVLLLSQAPLAPTLLRATSPIVSTLEKMMLMGIERCFVFGLVVMYQVEFRLHILQLRLCEGCEGRVINGITVVTWIALNDVSFLPYYMNHQIYIYYLCLDC